MEFKVIRHKEDAGYATYGTMFDVATKAVIMVTVERPWVDADHNGHRDTGASRIVAGRYRGIRAMSPKHGFPVWWLCGVPDVSSAEMPHEPTATTAQIHRANWPWQLNGCTGAGTGFGKIEYDGPTVSAAEDPRYPRERGKMYSGVSGSKTAFDKFMNLTKGVDEIWVTYVDAFGVPAGTWQD